MRERLNSVQLRQLLAYNPVDGLLKWKYRGQEWFETLNAFRRWNTMFAGRQAFTNCDEDGYLRGKILNQTYKAHQVIWCMCYGYYPTLIDHENNRRDDNRLFNLRDVSYRANSQNRLQSANNTSGVNGVDWHPTVGKWQARITYLSRRLHLGFYEKLEDAVKVRKSAEVIFGYHPNHGRKP